MGLNTSGPCERRIRLVGIGHASVTCAPVDRHFGTEHSPQVRVAVATWTGCLHSSSHRHIGRTHVFNDLGDIESIRLFIKLGIGRWVLIVAMQSGGNVGSGHVQWLPLDYGRKGTRLIAIPGKVGVELDDQLGICRGGDWFEQFLQPPTLEFLDCPLGGFKVFEVTVDVELGLKKNVPLLNSWMGGLSTGA
jgi:hypothetical protein